MIFFHHLYPCGFAIVQHFVFFGSSALNPRGPILEAFAIFQDFGFLILMLFFLIPFFFCFLLILLLMTIPKLPGERSIPWLRGVTSKGYPHMVEPGPRVHRLLFGVDHRGCNGRSRTLSGCASSRLGWEGFKNWSFNSHGNKFATR